MKVCLFISGTSLKQILIEGFENQGHSVEAISYQSLMPGWKNKFTGATSWMPDRLRSAWKEPYQDQVNRKYLELVKAMKPDLVLVYNNQELLPETVREIKKIAKTGFYLADSPLYSHTNRYAIALLKEADFIISPDSQWIEQIRGMGFHSTIHDIPGYSSKTNYRYRPTAEEKEKYTSDLVFLGVIYKNSWGYKRCLFLDQFHHLDIQIYTNSGWYKWARSFPGLQDKVQIKPFFPDKVVNTILNCSKLYPVDANPGLINGVHVRILDCIGSGILPLVEYRKDLEIFFNGVELPVIRDYNQAGEVAEKYLSDEKLRAKTLENLVAFINDRYLPGHFVGRLMKQIM